MVYTECNSLSTFFHMQTFEKRSSVVIQAEMLRWESLSYSFMTEQSDDEMDNNSFVVHPLPWQSQSIVIHVCINYHHFPFT